MDPNSQEVSGSSHSSSSSKLLLYSFWQSSCSWRVRFALNLKGLTYEYKAVDLSKGEQFSPEFERLNPLHYVPVLVDGDVVVGDSFAILLYLEEKYPQNALLPPDPQRRALNLQAASIVGSSIQPRHMMSVLKYIEEKAGPGERVSWTEDHMGKGFAALEKLLKDCSGRYATGDEVYMADVFLAPQISIAIARFNLDMTEFPTLTRIYDTYKVLPAFQASLPERQPDAIVQFQFFVDMDPNSQEVFSSSHSSSSTKLQLYSFWTSSCSWRVRFALNLKGLSYEYKSVDFKKGEHLSPEFERLNPLHYVPVLVDGDVVVGDSLAIVLYLEEKYPQNALLPPDLKRRALNLQAANIVCSSIQPLHLNSILEYIEEKVGPEERLRWIEHHVGKGLAALEVLLKDISGRYATGDEVYMADVFLAPQISIAITRFKLDMSKFPTLSRLYEAYKVLPEFQASLPERQPDAIVKEAKLNKAGQPGKASNKEVGLFTSLIDFTLFKIKDRGRAGSEGSFSRQRASSKAINHVQLIFVNVAS
ncbi:hypothetical protein NE237_013905 [Protea cynaroides]|uniref:glutathione transferase n=1 Tax=Protea cynaroides TaxID=273540 RepID=A0A9Q0JZE8_9MAGN|nr:hypothetical protein NE237_013905 [Protea cynaroides]